MPTPKKVQVDLDKALIAWSHIGQHPSLMDASQELNTAAALKRRRDAKIKKASMDGTHLYSVVVEQGFKNTADDRWAHKRLWHPSLVPGVFATDSVPWLMMFGLGKLSAIT